eukprot:Gb_22246 [translate_table: standard]
MARSLGLKRKVPSPDEVNSVEFADNQKDSLPKIKKQPFRPPFTTPKQNTLEFVKTDQQNLPMRNATIVLECNAIASENCKMTARDKAGDDGLLRNTAIQKQGKENIGTEQSISSQRTTSRITHEKCNVSESDSKERPSIRSGIQSSTPSITKTVLKGFLHTGFKPPANMRPTDDRLFSLATDKLKNSFNNIENSNQSFSVRTSPDDRICSISDDIKTLNPDKAGTRKLCMSRNLLNPTKNLHKNYEENVKGTVDARQTQFYSVLYCKRKKGAKLKGPWSDGVLLVCGRKCTLQDMDGKVTTKADCQGCMNMDEGATLEAISELELRIGAKDGCSVFSPCHILLFYDN